MDLLAVCLLVFIRIFSVTMTAPILGSNAVAIRTRLSVAIAMVLLVMPLIQVPQVLLIDDVGQGGFLAGKLFQLALGEATIGLALGLSVSIMFGAAAAAGTVVSQMAGMNIGDQPASDPVAGGSGPLARLFSVLSLAAFAVIGGPALVMSAVADTFVHLPLGTQLATDTLPGLMGDLLQQSFMLTLRAVGPVVVCLLVSNIVIGIISRTYPQMNLLGLGLTSNMVVMMGAVFLTVSGTVWLFVDDVKPTLDWTQQHLREAVIEPAVTSNEGPLFPVRQASFEANQSDWMTEANVGGTR